MIKQLHNFLEREVAWFDNIFTNLNSLPWASSGTREALRAVFIVFFCAVHIGAIIGLLVLYVAFPWLFFVTVFLLFGLPLIGVIFKGVKEYKAYRFGTAKEKKTEAVQHALNDSKKTLRP